MPDSDGLGPEVNQGEESPQGGGGGHGLPIGLGVKTIAEFVKESMKRAPPAMRLVIALTGMIMVVVLIIGGGLVLFASDKTTGLIALGVGMVGVLGVVALLRSMVMRVSGEIGSGGLRKWTGFFPRLPLPGAVTDQLAEGVKNIRTLVTKELRDRLPGLRDEQIRVNLFLPDTVATASGYAYKLVMSPSSVGSFTSGEEAVRIRPEEGATGHVFATRQSRITETRDFRATDRLLELIHRDLKWIISVPLKGAPPLSPVMGVLNVDCLEHEAGEVGHPCLEALMKTVEKEAASLGMLLEGSPAVQVEILVKDYSPSED